MILGKSDGINWRIIFAIAGLSIGIALGIVGASLYYSEKQQQLTVAASSNSANSGRRAEQYVTLRSGIPAYVERVISNPQPNTGKDHEKRDLAAQEASAAFAWWMVVVSTVGLLVTAFGTMLLFQQISLTREAVKDTSNATIQMARQTKIAEAAQRPYLHVERMGWQKNKYNGHWFFELVVKNFGLSPATGVIVNADVWFSKDGKPPLLWRIRKCDISDLMPQGKIEGVIVSSADTRVQPNGNADVSPKEDIYCRFEIKYRDAFGNDFGIFETYRLDRAKDGETGKFRFFSSP